MLDIRVSYSRNISIYFSLTVLLYSFIVYSLFIYIYIYILYISIYCRICYLVVVV